MILVRYSKHILLLLFAGVYYGWERAKGRHPPPPWHYRTTYKKFYFIFLILTQTARICSLYSWIIYTTYYTDYILELVIIYVYMTWVLL